MVFLMKNYSIQVRLTPQYFVPYRENLQKSLYIDFGK
jgi:hypothetical protein